MLALAEGLFALAEGLFALVDKVLAEDPFALADKALADKALIDKCNKSVVLEHGPFKCSRGKYNEGSILEVMVYRKKQSFNFVLWDDECIELIGKSAQKLNNMIFVVCVYMFHLLLSFFLFILLMTVSLIC
ncbi:hypothetical protein HKD37_15G042527 [Glycine soja]